MGVEEVVEEKNTMEMFGLTIVAKSYICQNCHNFQN